MAPWLTHTLHIMPPHLHLKQFNWYVPIAGLRLSMLRVIWTSLATAATDTAILTAPHNPRLPRITRTSFTWPNNSGMVQAVHKPRTIGRPLHAQATISSHKVLFLVMGTRPRDVEALWITSHPPHTSPALSLTLAHRPGNVPGNY